MATSWDELFTQVQPYVPGCPEVVIREHIRDAAIDFCERSEVWRYTFGPEQTAANERDYTVPTVGASDVENVVALYVEGTAIRRVSDLYTSLPPSFPASQPLHYSQLSTQLVRFYPTPDKAYSFSGTVVLKPSLTSSGMETFLYRAHGRSIACGAVASLTAIPDKEWSNFDLATYYDAKFLRQADDAKGRDTRRSGLHVKPMKFA